jgi:hypothetical protein
MHLEAPAAQKSKNATILTKFALISKKSTFFASNQRFIYKPMPSFRGACKTERLGKKYASAMSLHQGSLKAKEWEGIAG